ncbi:LytR family transcriptional regulator [Streptococcus pneumoniae]|nr:LytR family transcriptional regulator [Streptococcus pneumoniae]
MSKENPLSHHEQLRYDYLLKNIHYLNEREKNEFAYLQEKLTLARGNSSSSLEQEREEQVDLPSYANRSRSQSKSQALSFPPKKKRRKLRLKRIFMVIFSLLVCVALAMVFMFLRGYQDASAKKTADARAAQVEVFNGQDTRDGVNILIMGTDGRIGQNSVETRTDSIMVLNVGGSDKKMKLVSFMRDNLVYIDGYSQVINGRKQTDNKLNVAYELGEQEGQKGAEMVRQVLKDNFDLDIKYYALVDFQAFATAIDTLFPDGVTIDAQFSTLNGRPLTEATVGDDLYATSEALGKVFAMTSTNVPYTFLLTNGLSVLDGAKNGIEKLTIPELGDWVDAYDVYGGLGLLVDQNKYQTKLAQMGLR